MEEKNDIETVNCAIKVFKAERGYGFVTVDNSSKDAFFHKSAFPTNFHSYIKEGLEFKAEVRQKRDGKYQVRRCLDLL